MRRFVFVCLLCCACGDSESNMPPAQVGAGTGAAGTVASAAGRAAGGAPTSGTAGAAGRGMSQGAGRVAPMAGRGGGAGSAGQADAGEDAGAPKDPPTTTPPDPAAMSGTPGTFKIFDQIPQFGMYATSDPKNYTPPAGVLLWKRGTEFAAKLSAAQKLQIGADLVGRITYHAQCDNYDRIGGVFAVVVARDQMPKDNDPRIELARFITPFSDYKRGALATYVFPNADLTSYARMLADPTKDVWVGIGGGSNPYDGDPCTNTNMPAEFKAIGFKYSLEFVSTKPLAAGASTTLIGIYNVQAMRVPVTAEIDNPGEKLTGHVTVIVSGHGAESGGDEYMNTQDALSVNGQMVGSFNTKIDCAMYAKYSPDGNPGIFQNNNGGNPRNWCPGAPVLPHTFPATLNPGKNQISLAIDPARVPMGSYYATSISFSAP
ncbi:MAG TPA: peptide-N-glycosidase F-related protein [Polyangiales bacterium]|nr:peptide-N-glycosidase F-related protein [Polyangiales bacterium]